MKLLCKSRALQHMSWGLTNERSRIFMMVVDRYVTRERLEAMLDYEVRSTVPALISCLPAPPQHDLMYDADMLNAARESLTVFCLCLCSTCNAT